MDSPSPGCGGPHPCTLAQLGWREEHAEALKKYSGPYIPGRVTCRQKTVWDVITDTGSVRSGISGALRNLGRYPAVGDFVVLLHQPASGTDTIVDILPRKTVFTRGASGDGGTDQVIAANVDIIFIVTAAGPDLNARRIERYLAVASASGARPVIILNKADLADNPVQLAEEILPSSAGIPVLAVSAREGAGIAQLDPFLSPGTTIALIGSSGVGKSTLINRLLDKPVQDTSPIRDSDGRGRHTTTVRQLFVLPGGAIMIDNPGLREVGIGTASSGIGCTFPDILELAQTCRFSDCRHEHEPGCAVQEAVRSGTLSAARLGNYHRLLRELAFEQDKAEIGLARTEKKRWKGIAKSVKDLGKPKWE